MSPCESGGYSYSAHDELQMVTRLLCATLAYLGEREHTAYERALAANVALREWWHRHRNSDVNRLRREREMVKSEIDERRRIFEEELPAFEQDLKRIDAELAEAEKRLEG